MATQLEEAGHGKTTPAMIAAAGREAVSAEVVREHVARGHAVIPANPIHTGLEPAVVGRAFRVKVNANIGRSPTRSCKEEELEKLSVAVSAGADFVMDLSVGPEVQDMRQVLLAATKVPFGTVPIYEALWRAGGDIDKLNRDLLLSVIKEQAGQGVDFMTIHAGLLKRHLSGAARRKMGIVSRGGVILAEWITRNNKENPLYSAWSEVTDICRAHDVTVSLGDGLRPGCLADASDDVQFAELDVLGELVQSCREKGVQVMVEGPGHVPFDQIQMNVERERHVCDDAPFYVLGPVVTDVAPGYDHITSCIGATAAAYHGASLLCYVTPAEHLGLPTSEEVKTGVIAYRIAAHAADVARNVPGARDWDDEMARARFDFDWNRQFELSMDSSGAKARYEMTKSSVDGEDDHCSMCGREFCAVRAFKRLNESDEQPQQD